MSKDWRLRLCAYEISNPGVDLKEMSRVKEVTGVETRRNARKRDEVAVNIECALYTTWLRFLQLVRCQERLLHVGECVQVSVLPRLSGRYTSSCEERGRPLTIWVNRASKAYLYQGRGYA